MGEQTEGIGIALEMDEVVPKDRAYLSLELGTCTIEEIGLHGFLPTMAERGIAQVMSQASGGNNLSDFLK